MIKGFFDTHDKVVQLNIIKQSRESEESRFGWLEKEETKRYTILKKQEIKEEMEERQDVIIYQNADGLIRLAVHLQDESVWVNRQQMSLLFNRDVKTIGKHINNVFAEGELQKSSTFANFATVQNEGGREVDRQIEHYNLDVITSVGYRVKSKQGINLEFEQIKY